MKNLIYLILCMTKVQTARGYIPPIDFILTKSTTTTGRQIVSIEQDVIFKIGDESSVVQETWLIEGDKNLKLNARGSGFFKSNIDLNYLYNGKNKTILIGKNRSSVLLGTDFFQRLLFIRSTETFKNYLKELGVSSQVRFSRADSRPVFAIGTPSAQKLNPQIWIDQDDFSIRKLRLPSEIEVELSDVQQISNELYVAKNQRIYWAGLIIEVKVRNISLKTKTTLASFYPQNLTAPSVLLFPQKTILTEAITQFYLRLR